MKKKVLILPIVAVACVIGVGVIIFQKKEIDEKERKSEKFKKYYQILNKWVANVNMKVNNEMLLERMGCTNIAIYGNGEIGCRLAESLKDSSIEIKCIIEKKGNDGFINDEDKIPIVGIDDISEYSDVDAIIVTPMFDYDSIEAELLLKNIGAKIVSVEELVYSADL